MNQTPSAPLRTVTLNRIPQKPSFNLSLPSRILTVLHEHIDNDLVRCHEASRDDWPNNLQVAFCKRRYLYLAIKEKATGPTKNEMENAPRVLDRDRNILSVSQYLEKLKRPRTQRQRKGVEMNKIGPI